MYVLEYDILCITEENVSHEMDKLEHTQPWSEMMAPKPECQLDETQNIFHSLNGCRLSDISLTNNYSTEATV